VIESGKFKIGRNIFFKNNLKSLKIVKRSNTGTPKVDHDEGPIPDPQGNAEWETSLIGLNAKDVSDAVCGSVYAANSLLAPLGAPEMWTDDNIGLITEDFAKESISNLMQQMGLVMAD
jgi:hypothetical protein